MADGKVTLSTALDNSGVEKDMQKMTGSAKSQAAKLAGIYRKQGMSQSESMKKAWSEIERTSEKYSSKTGDSIKNNIGGATARVVGDLGGLTKVLLSATAVITAAFATAAVAITKQAVDAYAEYEQLAGGVETLFKNSASKVQAYSEDAFYTTGMSANEYMQAVTSFSASLISSLAGDTEKAADVANMAMIDMSDNANKMGTEAGLIQNAYQGFAKQNYTMLDNLKLGRQSAIAQYKPCENDETLMLVA